MSMPRSRGRRRTGKKGGSLSPGSKEAAQPAATKPVWWKRVQLPKWATTVWARCVAAIALIGAILGLGPLLDMWRNLEPRIELRTVSNGDLLPFSIHNDSGFATFDNFTPHCSLEYTVWRFGRLPVEFEFEGGKEPRRPGRLSSGEVQNFECNMERVMGPPTLVVPEGYVVPLPEVLLVRLRVYVTYSIPLGPFSFQRTHKSQLFCGFNRGEGTLVWQEGEAMAPQGRSSDELDRTAFQSGWLTRCYTPDQARRLNGFRSMGAPRRFGDRQAIGLPVDAVGAEPIGEYVAPTD